MASLLVAGSFMTACTKDSEEKSIKIEQNTNSSKCMNFNTYVDKVDELVKLNWPAMGKVWPTYNYSNHNFLIFNLDNNGNVKEARLLNTKENRKLKKEEYMHINAPSPEGYDQLEFQGKPSIVMSVDDMVMKANDSIRELYKTATHEMVHFYYQSEIQASADSSRSQLYPIDSCPRIIRGMLYQRLIQAFEHPDKQENYLQKAKYWLEKYHKEFKSEADNIRSTDIAEATARYTENLGIFIGKNLSKKAIKKQAGKFIKKNEIFVAADKESYEIGYVAALILDGKLPNWKENFYSTQKSVEEVLLEKISAVPDKMDKKLAEQITKKVNVTNKNAKGKLKNIIKAVKDNKIPYLHLDVSQVSKSFYAQHMFSYQELSIMSGYSSKFNAGDKIIDIKDTAIISGYEKENQYIRIPLTMKYSIKDGKLSIKSEHLTVGDVSVQKSTENGRTIYSTQVQD